MRPNAKPFSSVESISCPAANNCTAAGMYSKTGWGGVFLDHEQAGTWQSVMHVPGIGALSVGAPAVPVAVSCTNTKNCSLGGNYTDSAHQQQAFVDIENQGVWRRAEEVPGSATISKGGTASLASLSCGAPGNCAAVGNTSAGPFVVNETNGTWGTAQLIPGLAALNRGKKVAEVSAVSCSAAGNCTLGGDYTDSAGRGQVYGATETGGTWGDAVQLPGTATTVKNGTGGVAYLSCASPGNCAAVGDDEPVSGANPFAVTETNGTWGQADNDLSGVAELGALSCSAPGDCVLGGKDAGQATVLTETNGTWGTGMTVPGTAAQNPDGDASVTALSCPSTGNCAVTGYVTQDQGDYTVLLPFTEDEIAGSWDDNTQVYYSGVGPAAIGTVSCGAAQNCGAGGSYGIGNGCNGKAAAFVINELPTGGAPASRAARSASPAEC